jgi:glycine hydroxymethyltransferase
VDGRGVVYITSPAFFLWALDAKTGKQHWKERLGDQYYAAAVVDNAKALADGLVERGFDLVSGGTDNHLLLIDLTSKDIGGKPAAQALDRAGIVTNYNTVPFDPRKPFDPSGIRLGTPAVTSRGMGSGEMEAIAAWIDRGVEAAKAGADDELDRIRKEVEEVVSDFPAPGILT